MKVITTILMCMTITHCMAQETDRFSLGIKAGAGLSGWHTDYNGTTSSPRPEHIIGDRFVSAYAFGLSGKYILFARLGLNLNLLYIQGGSKYVRNYKRRLPGGTEVVNRNEVTFNLRSIRTPFYLSYDFGDGSFQPFVKLGVSYNRILGGNRETFENNATSGESLGFEGPLLLDFPDNQELLHDWSFFSGIGILYQQRLSLEAELWLGPPRSYAFSDRFSAPACIYCSTVNYWDRTYHNRTILLSLSYLLIN